MRKVLEPQGVIPEICPKCKGWGTILSEKQSGKEVLVVEHVCPRCLGERVLFERSLSRNDRNTFGFIKTE